MTLVHWLRALGVDLSPQAQLHSFLCWPRFQFGDKTIQPDIVATFDQAIVLMEFKRPSGGSTPGTEALGQAAFARYAASYLNTRWALLFVPSSPAEIARSSQDWVSAMRQAKQQTLEKWPTVDLLLQELLRQTDSDLAKEIATASWPRVVAALQDTVQTQLPETWSKRRILEALAYFLEARKALWVQATTSSAD